MFKLFASPKKKHFLRKLQNVQQSIWDREFQKFQGMEMRESIRLERDRAMEAADAFRVESERDHTPETKAELESKKKIALDNADRFTKQMAMLDNEINGVPFSPGDEAKGIPPSAGQQGLTEIISGLNEVKKMFITYLKTL